MGYSTDFEGSFKVDKPLDTKTFDLLHGLATTRRMKRKGLDTIYGVDGEFYIAGKGFMGQEDDRTVVDHNIPPSTQPSLWLQWVIERRKDGDYLLWNGGEKFYSYIEWLQYLIDHIFKPGGYKLNGEVLWQGEDMGDRGKITIKNNVINTRGLE